MTAVTAVVDAESWCALCKRRHLAHCCAICCADLHYGQPNSRICSRCKAVLRTSRLHGIEPPHAPLTTRREYWLPATRLGLRGKYAVSNRGRIRSTRTGKVLVATTPRKGYPSVTVGGKHVRLHTLVLETWVGPRPPGQECCHRDDVRSHNHLRNLHWGSRSENTLHSVRNGRHPNARKRLCRNGHRYTSDNTYRDNRGRRRCKICQRADTLRWKAKRAEGLALAQGTTGNRPDSHGERRSGLPRVTAPDMGANRLQGNEIEQLPGGKTA